MLNFLPKAEDEIKYELTKKLQDSIVKYSVSYKWEIDSLIKMVINSKGKIYEDVLSQIINEIIKVKDLYIYSSHKAFLALKVKKNENNPSLAKLCIYIIGELCTYLTNNNTLNCKNEQITVSEDDILNLLKEVGIKNNNLGNETVIEYLLNALVKLLIKFPDKRNDIESIIKNYKRSYFSEVQSRALEYLQFNKSNKNEMKNKMVGAVPLPKKVDGEGDKEENKKIVDDNDEDNYDPEDDIICVRLTEGAVKNINLNNNNNNINDNQNNNNPLDFLGVKDNINNNNNNQGGNLDLLDLNNIFSGATGDQNNNDNKANNNSNNPFDILNLQLEQTNNTNDNQSQQNNNNNNNINDLLNMVIGTNNNNNNNQTNNNDLFSQIENLSNDSNEKKNGMKECFKNEEISLFYSITKKEGSNIDGSVYASNNSNGQITEVKINFLVQKFVKLTVLNTSGNILEPSQSLGIKKDFTLTSNDPKKKNSNKNKITLYN